MKHAAAVLGFALACLLSLALPQRAHADRILAGLPLDDGATWEIVGVTLHNYKPSPWQKELGTFVIKNTDLLKQMQQTWDFRLMFDDYCDWHYSLKIYRNRDLVKTLKVNLHCNYITDGAFSYRFDPQLMGVFRDRSLRLPWSRIRYTRLENLRVALRKLDARKDVYFYNDVRPFQYDGYFMVGLDRFPLRVNRDSLDSAMTARVRLATGSEDFYLVRHLMSIDDKARTLNFRYLVYCDQAVANRYVAAERRNGTHTALVEWRGHLLYEPYMQLMVVGINQASYWRDLGLVRDPDAVYE